MRRAAIYLLATIYCLLAALAADAADIKRLGQDTDGCWIVVGANWNGTIRGGHKIKKCSGTVAAGGDLAQIQAAVDGAAGDAAAGGGKVLVLGTVYPEMPTDQTAWSGSGHFSDVNTLVVDTWDGSYSIDDVNQGELIRIYDNTGVAGSDCSSATFCDDVVATVTAAAGANIDIGGPDLELTSYTNSDHVKFRRVIPIIDLPPGVHLSGFGPEVSQIRVRNDNAAGEWCIVGVDDTTAGGAGNYGFFLSDIEIYGNNAAGQNDNSAVTHGFIKNAYGPETSLSNVGVWNCTGSGVIINESHGFRFYGTSWTEGNDEHGIVISGSHAWISDIKATGNGRCNVLFKSAKDCSFKGRVGASVASSTGIHVIGSSTCNITGAGITLEGDSAKGLWWGYQAIDNSATGCNWYIFTGTGMSAIYTGYWGNTTVGGAMRHLNGTVTFVNGSAGTIGANTVKDVMGVPLAQERVVIRALNSTGSSITTEKLVARDPTAGDHDEIVEADTDNTLGAFVVGLTEGNTISNGNYGWVQTKGYTTRFPVLDPTNAIAVGDFLGASATAGTGQAVGTGEDGGAGWAIAIAMEAQGAGAGATELNAVLLGTPVYVP